MIELDNLETVEGEDTGHDLVLFAISTCGWCRKARNFLEENKLAYRYVYLDVLEGEDQRETLAVAAKWNPRKTFPTLIIDDNDVLVGFKDSEYKEKLL